MKLNGFAQISGFALSMLFCSCDKTQKQRDFAFLVDSKSNGSDLPMSFKLQWDGATVEGSRSDYHSALTERIRFKYHCVIYDFEPDLGDNFSKRQKTSISAALENHLNRRIEWMGLGQIPIQDPRQLDGTPESTKEIER